VNVDFPLKSGARDADDMAMTSGVAGLARFSRFEEARRHRRARVARIREAVRSGAYFVSAEDVARCLSRRLALLPFGEPEAQTR